MPPMSLNAAQESAPSPLTLRVAEEVRALMGRRRVSQMQLADVLGVAQTGVSKRLRGRIPFDANEIGVLAAFFGVAPAVLVGGAPAPRTTEPSRLPRPDSDGEPAVHPGLSVYHPKVTDSYRFGSPRREPVAA